MAASRGVRGAEAEAGEGPQPTPRPSTDLSLSHSFDSQVSDRVEYSPLDSFDELEPPHKLITTPNLSIFSLLQVLGFSSFLPSPPSGS